jgi:hypothetical protein
MPCSWDQLHGNPCYVFRSDAVRSVLQRDEDRGTNWNSYDLPYVTVDTTVDRERSHNV